jgi:hypothetical protein
VPLDVASSFEERGGPAAAARDIDSLLSLLVAERNVFRELEWISCGLFFQLTVELSHRLERHDFAYETDVAEILARYTVISADVEHSLHAIEFQKREQIMRRARDMAMDVEAEEAKCLLDGSLSCLAHGLLGDGRICPSRRDCTPGWRGSQKRADEITHVAATQKVWQV